MTSVSAFSNKSLSVVGLGYIGLPTAIVFAQNGWKVIGVDVNQRVVDEVNKGVLPFEEVGLEEVLSQVVAAGTLHAQTNPASAEVYIVAVPTPFHPDKTADLKYIQAAAEEIAPLLEGNELLVLESTSPPGTTEKMAQWVEEKRQTLGLPTVKVHYAHAPERVLPGRILIELSTNDRVIGGITPEAAELARQVYASFCTGELCITDARTAEMSKLAENSFRDVNIAYANELSLICDRLGIDVWELISLANRHPRVNILQPGPGVGGHCIAVDPWFVVEAAPEEAVLIKTSRAVNDYKPEWVIKKVIEALAKSDENKQVAVLGLSFKPDIDDLRESPAVSITARLAQELPDVTLNVAEPHVDQLPPALINIENVSLLGAEEALEESDVVLLLVDHQAFRNIDTTLLSDKLIIDTKGFWRE